MSRWGRLTPERRAELNARRKQHYILHGNDRRYAKYGLTREMFDEYLDAQEGACAFCGNPLPADRSKINTDHDHATGQYRGLVHSLCNQAIGLGEMHLSGYLEATSG